MQSARKPVGAESSRYPTHTTHREAGEPAKIGFAIWRIQIRWTSTTRGTQFVPLAPYLAPFIGFTTDFCRSHWRLKDSSHDETTIGSVAVILDPETLARLF